MSDRTDELIAYIVHKQGGVKGRVVLAKLVYMVDLEARGWLGHPISTMEYVRDHGGPYDRAFEEHTEHAKDAVRISWEAVHDYNVCVHEPVGSMPNVSFSPAERLVIDRTLAEYGGMSRRELLEDVVYETRPMKGAVGRPVGTPLEMGAEDFALKKKYGIDFEQIAASVDEMRAGKRVDVSTLIPPGR